MIFKRGQIVKELAGEGCLAKTALIVSTGEIDNRGKKTTTFLVLITSDLATYLQNRLVTWHGQEDRYEEVKGKRP